MPANADWRTSPAFQRTTRATTVNMPNLRGPAIAALSEVPRVGEVDGYSLHLVDQRLRFDVRHELAHVAMVAHRTMPRYKAGYDGSITDNDQRLYLLVVDGRAVAMAVTSLDNVFWKLCWNDDCTAEILDTNAEVRTGFKIARVWAAKEYRGRGLGAKLVFETLRQLACAIDQVGWAAPFTRAGRAFVRRLRPSKFLACGDPYSVHKVLARGDDE